MSFKRISAAEAQQQLASGAVLVDIRDPNAFAAAHVDGAVRLGNDNLQQFLAGANPDTPLLVMCYHGHSSQSAAQFFVGQGFAHVASVDGGFEGWRRQLPFVSGS
jgi:thiosulfate sulfurtransferase